MLSSVFILIHSPIRDTADYQVPATVSVVSNIPSGGKFPYGVNNVTLMAVDKFGNLAYCSFDVIVRGTFQR